MAKKVVVGTERIDVELYTQWCNEAYNIIEPIRDTKTESDIEAFKTGYVLGKHKEHTLSFKETDKDLELSLRYPNAEKYALEACSLLESLYEHTVLQDVDQERISIILSKVRDND